jgi:hypothetical protein
MKERKPTLKGRRMSRRAGLAGRRVTGALSLVGSRQTKVDLQVVDQGDDDDNDGVLGIAQTQSALVAEYRSISRRPARGR